MLTLAVVLSVVSCKKETESSANSSADSTENKEVTQEEKDASYAFGLSLGQQVENMKNNPTSKDSVIYAEVNRGAEDFLKDSEVNSSYLLGMRLGQQIDGAMKNPVLKGALVKDEMLQGLADYLDGKETHIPVDSINVIMQNFYQKQVKSSAESNKQKGKAFLDAKKKEDGVITTDSGLAYKVIKEGTGESPKLGDKVKVKYTGKTIEGKVFDSTEKGNGDNKAVEFPLADGSLIPAWIEAMQLMKKGGKYELYVPSELGYGDNGAGPDIKGGSTLIFDIELEDFTKGAKK